MANDYFQDDGNPGFKGPLASGAIRTLFAAVETAWDKVVGLTGNGGKIVAINAAGTAQEALSTTGTGNVVRATSPTLVTPALGTPASGVLDNCSLSSAKTTPIDADSLVLVDSAAASVMKNLTWANLKATLKAYFDTLYVALTGNQTIAGVKTFSSPVGVAAAAASGDAVRKDQLITNNLVGTTTNDNATAGNIGEFVQSIITNASGVSITSGVSVNVTSISLTAGDWDVTGNIFIVPTASTTYAGGGASTTSASLGEFSALQAATSTASVQISLPIPMLRVSIASTTTVYLVAQAAFASGTCKGSGRIQARRVR